MIHVIATVELKPGKRGEYLKIFKANVPKVLAEKGCVAYGSTVDTPSGIPIQPAARENVVVILEAWESLDALGAHLKTPHMAAYFAAVKDLVTGTSLQVLKPA